MHRAVFLDRDGVINEMVPGGDGPDSPRSLSEFRLIAGAASAIKSFNELRLPVVVVSNQPGIAKGKLRAEDLDAMTAIMRLKVSEEFGVIDGLYYCLHHPQAVVVDYRVECDCRKPRAGLLTMAAREMSLTLGGSYMVGDQLRDMTAGKSVGCTTLFVTTGAPSHQPGEADYVCNDLADAARLIAELEEASLAVY